MSNLLGRTLRHRDDPLLSFTHPFSYFTNYFYEYIHISNDRVCYVEGWRGVTGKGGTCGGIYWGGIDGGLKPPDLSRRPHFLPCLLTSHLSCLKFLIIFNMYTL